MDKLTNINNRIESLKKRKAKLQTQQAVLFTKEVEKIFKESFAPGMALAVLSDWTTASETKKKEWANKAPFFRFTSPQCLRQKAETRNSTSL
jgi:hypothetical protein